MEGHALSQRRLDYRAALVTAMIAEVNRDKKKKASPFQPKDFMPVEKGKEQTVEQQLMMAKIITAALGGDDTGN